MPLVAVLRRSLSSTAAGAGATATAKQRFPNLPNIHTKYKPQAIEEAQSALIDYLHGTRSVPFTYAELIATNSLSSLCTLVRKVPFSAPTFSKTFKKLLRYQPIDEFEFFFESIGIDHEAVPRFLLHKKFFFSEERAVLDSACALHGFGFPWNRLGMLYQEEVSIFGMCSDELVGRLQGLKERYGLGSLSIVGVCLAFPQFLIVDAGVGIEAVFHDLKRVFVEFDIAQCVEGNVDAWYEVCCKVRVFYDLGCERGTVGELMCKGKEVFLRCPREVLVRKAEYFNAFDVGKDEVGLLLLRRPELLSLDWEKPVVSVLRLLRHFGLDENELQGIAKKYPYVVGRNEMVNLPNVMRALDLNVWFFDKVKSSNPQLLATCAISCRDEDVDKEFAEAFKRLESSYRPLFMKKKVEYIKQIGFGENALTMKVIDQLHGSGEELQQRFEFLQQAGVEHSKLCYLIRKVPKIFCQCSEVLEAKLKFICGEMGCSLDYLDTFPAILCFDLFRIEFRYRFYMWLRQRGLCKKDYSIASMIATSEKNFIRRLFGIHPAVPKQYLERFSHKRFIDGSWHQ